VALGLLLNALLGVDHQEGHVGARGSGDHVLQELLVTRRVDDDVVAPFRLEEHLRDVDRDALVALFLEAVEEERELERLPLVLADFLHVGDLGLGDETGLGQELPDERGFPVVDVAHHDEPEGLRRSARGGFRFGGGHHMYPFERRRCMA